MASSYEDIIHLPHPTSKKHPRMSSLARAAQFAPFAALVGHKDAVEETARLTDERVELEEYEKEALDRCMQLILGHLEEKPLITVTYFEQDLLKAGGTYQKAVGRVQKVDVYHQLLFLEDKILQIEDISEIGGPWLESLQE